MHRIVVLTLLLLAPILPAQEENHDATVEVKFDDVAKWLERFEPPGRGRWQQPTLVLRMLGVTEGMTVADLGAGTGYFTTQLVSAVGQSGKVYAVDIEPAMLEYLAGRKEMLQSYFDNLETVLAAPDDPRLPDGEVELILVVNTWHHIDARLDYIKKLQRALVPVGGRVALIDWHAGDLPLGPPPEHKLSREAVIAEFEQAGWTRTLDSVALPYQYMMVFYPPR